MEEKFEIQDIVNEAIAAEKTTEEILTLIHEQTGIPVEDDTMLSALVSKAINEQLIFGKVTIHHGPPTYYEGSTGTWVGR